MALRIRKYVCIFFFFFGNLQNDNILIQNEDWVNKSETTANWENGSFEDVSSIINQINWVVISSDAQSSEKVIAPNANWLLI